jgi:ribosome-associated protein
VEPLKVTNRLTIPPEELQVSFARSGGPGGQNVNKVASKALLRFSITESTCLTNDQRRILLERLSGRLVGEGEILIQASNHREQARNIEDARARLAAILNGALTPRKKRRPTKPTRSSQRRRLDAKRQRGQIKKDRRKNDE